MAETSVTPIVYNLNHQSLNAEKLRGLNSFTSDNFGGFIGASNPISIADDGTIHLSKCTLIAGGILFDIPECTHTFTEDNNLWYARIQLRGRVNDVVTDYTDANTLTSSNVDIIKLTECYCSDFNWQQKQTLYYPVTSFEQGVTPASAHYYEYDNTEKKFNLSTDETIYINKTYYYTYDSKALYFKTQWGDDTETNLAYAYAGKIIWVQDTADTQIFTIPLCAKIDGSVIQVVKIRDLTALEDLLSSEAYNKLKTHIDENFVWTSAGDESIGDHKKGDIGSLHVTDNIISPISSTQKVTIKEPAFSLSGAIPVGHQGFILIDTSTGAISQSDSSATIPLYRGGTGASSALTARENLKINYGTSLPLTAEDGDIFLKIIQ